MFQNTRTILILLLGMGILAICSGYYFNNRILPNTLPHSPETFNQKTCWHIYPVTTSTGEYDLIIDILGKKGYKVLSILGPGADNDKAYIDSLLQKISNDTELNKYVFRIKKHGCAHLN